VETSDLLEYTYKLKKIKNKNKDNYVLHKVVRPGEPDVKLDYSQKNDDEELRLQTTTFGDDNFLETHYYHKWGSDLPNQQVVIFDKETKKFLYGRVSKQKAPVGTAGKPVTTHSYLYKKLKNSNCRTSVVDPYGNR